MILRFLFFFLLSCDVPVNVLIIFDRYIVFELLKNVGDMKVLVVCVFEFFFFADMRSISLFVPLPYITRAQLLLPRSVRRSQQAKMTFQLGYQIKVLLVP